MRLGLDIGNGFVKLADKVVFATKLKEGSTTQGFKGKGLYDVTYNGIDYIVGDGSSIRGKNRYFTDDYKLMLLTAIAISSKGRTNIDAQVVIGVPVDYFATLKKQIEEELSKIENEEIIVDGKKYRINKLKVTVFIEGALPILLNDDGHIVTMDIGTGTINVIEWKNQAILNKFTSRDGFQALYLEIATLLNSHF